MFQNTFHVLRMIMKIYECECLNVVLYKDVLFVIIEKEPPSFLRVALLQMVGNNGAAKW